MTKKNKGGRPPYYKVRLMQERKKIILSLIKKGYSKVEIADIFNIDPSNLSRV